ncbi:MerR family transcriptional regulator [Rhodococcus sp. D2-41]|uniref:MerR family transcriptional regulator n=1 Tax=Speluncibacter jeojiensis TaxID=2710754 RepID=A0A9X4M9A8_9ACTN|nr:MerR family transcriptional regulator [Rhodococcus sp. D2-41]MDG3009963.1 MerR family transcriptional regulator [Rhodococcus sp. D2-41]MDG3016336.1 MerR family transcriptional regulator [Corynebacteriales bacterium D3-21]
MKEYRIDDLAREAGVSVRNVRVYQDRGLLLPPRRQGRSGWYSENHLARLRLISRMLDRGYTFATIRELLTAAQYGLRVEDLFETGDIGGRWGSIRQKARLTMAELRKLFGERTTAADIERTTELGALAADGEDGYSVRRPQLVQAASALVEVGVPLEDLLSLAEHVRADLQDVAQRFVGLVADHYLGTVGSERDLDPDKVREIATLINKVRPDANRVVQVLLAESMEQEIAKAIGRAADQLQTDE